jgi:hypothetical protein
MPHPKGDIRLSLKRAEKNGLDGFVMLPEGVTGTFIWNDTSMPLESGMTKLGAAAENGGVPDKIQLGQNFPNPFNLSTAISYALPESADMQLVVYDLNGSLTRTLVKGDVNQGTHQVVWNGENGNGIKVASGIYFYRLKARNFVDSKRMMLIK